MRIQASSHLRLFALLIAITLTILATSAPSRAQSDSPPGKLLLTYQYQLDLIGWDSDEKLLGITLDGYKSTYVDIATGDFVQYASTPVPPAQLTAAELSAFGIELDAVSEPSSYYSISPDENYVVYRVPNESEYSNLEDGDCKSRKLRLANRSTKLTSDLPFILKLPLYFEWTSDSQGLMIGISTPCDGPGSGGVLAYVSNLSPTLDDLHIVQFAEIPQLQMDLGQLQVTVSEDGQSLLAAVLPYYSEQGTRLVLVDVANPTQSTIIADNIDGFLTAKLIAETPATILMVSAAGLTELSLTGQRTVLDSRLKTTGVTYDCSAENYVKDASISPSGRWLAYTHCDPYLGETSLYLLDLHALRHPNSPPPTIAPTFTPIHATIPLPTASVRP